MLLNQFCIFALNAFNQNSTVANALGITARNKSLNLNLTLDIFFQKLAAHALHLLEFIWILLSWVFSLLLNSSLRANPLSNSSLLIAIALSRVHHAFATASIAFFNLISVPNSLSIVAFAFSHSLAIPSNTIAKALAVSLFQSLTNCSLDVHDNLANSSKCSPLWLT